MKINVRHVAKLANLQLTDEEIPKFEKQLSSILDYIKKLQEVDTTGVAETSPTTDSQNIIREDASLQSLPKEDALAGSKNDKTGHFKVKNVLKKT